MAPNTRDHTKTPRTLTDKNVIKSIAINGKTEGEIANTLLATKHDHIIQNTTEDIFSTVVAKEKLYTGDTRMVLVDRNAYEAKYKSMVDKANEMKLLLDTVRIFEPQITHERKEYLRLINDYNLFITKKLSLREQNMNEYKHYPTEKVRVNTRVFAEEQTNLNHTLLSMETHTKYMNKILDLNHITIEH